MGTEQQRDTLATSNRKNGTEWRKQEDELQKMDETKQCFRGHAARWPQLEVDMKQWLTCHRNSSFSVSTEMIIYEAERLAAEKGIEDVTGSPSWCHRFMKTCGLALCNKTRVAQKMPIEYESKIVSFHKFVLDARKKNGFGISQTENVDEVPLTFDVPSNKTVDVKGTKTITSGHDKTHYTVVLSCCADGTKLPPMLILKRKKTCQKRQSHEELLFMVMTKDGWKKMA
ncbi:hypothetical protein HJG60_010108 [Phyllostomus discolor]|uniref:HTH CENPB-type domain-containing protein n=1 Tax=Phyllostomus discolor TaxID=89673 RepID=A0A834EJL6_9CHIR|nr:hypothetical protein HJG60_010108 [Phyllostomus discolor]